MKLVTYVPRTGRSQERLGAVHDHWVIDVQRAALWAELEAKVPGTMLEFLSAWDAALPVAKAAVDAVLAAKTTMLTAQGQPLILQRDQVKLRAPLPRPASIRDFYGFEQHVKTVRGKRGSAVPPEWYEIPVFYFSNHHAIVGPEEEIIYPSATQALDFELELACVVGPGGMNISAQDAPRHIAGYTIMNDWSARDLQRQEMAVGLGPAKGKDFATSLGPYLITPDELEDRREGERHHLAMTARINSREVSRGNFKDIYWTFPQMIERAARDVYLYPGDVLGSGTVGTGCLLETGGAWLEPGDMVELEIERLGVLRNTIAPPRR